MHSQAQLTDREEALYELFMEVPKGKRIQYLSGDMNEIHSPSNRGHPNVAMRLYENGRALLTQEVTSSKVVPVSEEKSVIKNTYNYYLTRT